MYREPSKKETCEFHSDRNKYAIKWLRKNMISYSDWERIHLRTKEIDDLKSLDDLGLNIFPNQEYKSDFIKKMDH